ncbi:MAG: hypothetical protein ACRDMV_03660 [Streptosporangiales bacterium]
MIAVRWRNAGAAPAVALALVVLSGCGVFEDDRDATPTPTATATTAMPSAAPTSRPTGTVIPAAKKVDYTNPSAVCNAFADTLFSGNPLAEDQLAPLRRAADYVSPEYKEAFLRHAPRLAQWHAWRGAGATRLVHTRLRYVGEKPDKGTRTRKHKAVSRRVVPIDAEGNPVGRTYGFVVYCTLDREQGRWLVSSHRQGEIDANA